MKKPIVQDGTEVTPGRILSSISQISRKKKDADLQELTHPRPRRTHYSGTDHCCNRHQKDDVQQLPFNPDYDD